MHDPNSTRDEIGTQRRRGVRGQAFDVVLRCFADSIGADTAMILGRSGGRTEIVASWAREGHEVSVAWTGGNRLTQVLEGSGPFFEPTAPVDRGARVSAVAAPIRSPEHAIGAIYAGFSPATAAGADALGWSAESYGRLAGLCMTGDLSLAAVLGSVGFDTLTGCLSYGGLVEVISAEIQRSLRAGHRLTCCFLDLDDFKRVNDEQGHLEGNRVLTAVGRGLRESARTYDSVGRFGGDEFVVLLPETTAASGGAIARRYRAAVLRSIGELTSVAVDVSVGIAEWNRSDSAAQLLGAADKALTEAKAAGGAAVAPATSETRLDGLLELSRDLIRRRKSADLRQREDEPRP